MGIIQSGFNKLLMSSIGLSAAIGKSQASLDKKALKEAEATLAQEKDVQEQISQSSDVDPELAALEKQRSSTDIARTEEEISELRSRMDPQSGSAAIAKARLQRAAQEEALKSLELEYDRKRNTKKSREERESLMRSDETKDLLLAMGINLENIKGWEET